MVYNASKGPHTFEITIDQEYLKKYVLGFLNYLDDHEDSLFFLEQLLDKEEEFIGNYLKEHPFGE